MSRLGGNDDEEVILALPARIAPIRHVRSTVILASIASVRNRGEQGAYERALAAEHKETLLTAVAGTWIALPTALAHYAACDALGLTPDQQVHAGRSTFDGSRGTILGTAVRMARGAGVTPWVALPMMQRFWNRGCDGGGIGVTRAGPKDAHLSVVQCPLLASPYFRHGLRGLCAAMLDLFCTRTFVSERPQHDALTVRYRVQWA